MSGVAFMEGVLMSGVAFIEGCPHRGGFIGVAFIEGWPL